MAVSWAWELTETFSACSANWPMMVLIRSKEAAVSSAMDLPFSTACNALEISSPVFWEASAVLAASLRTSSATTAKPFPALPARAASTAAFRARMLVWNAMSSMLLMILPISEEVVLMFCMATSISCILPVPRDTSATDALTLCSVSSTRRVFSSTCWEISASVAASSCTLEACCVEP